MDIIINELKKIKSGERIISLRKALKLVLQSFKVNKCKDCRIIKYRNGTLVS